MKQTRFLQGVETFLSIVIILISSLIVVDMIQGVLR